MPVKKQPQQAAGSVGFLAKYEKYLKGEITYSELHGATKERQETSSEKLEQQASQRAPGPASRG